MQWISLREILDYGFGLVDENILDRTQYYAVNNGALDDNRKN